MEFEQLDSQEIYSNRVFQLRKEQVRYPDGREATFDIIAHGGAVAILPIDADDVVWMVRQYRQGKHGLLLEVPAGTLEAGEAPEVCAAREIQEEIGMGAHALELIGSFYLAPGYSSEYMYVYLATDLYPAELEKDADEFIEIEKVPLDRLLAMLDNNEIDDGKTLAALALARNRLNY